MSERYTGKPFLELLDAYVLDAIGHLDTARDADLTAREAGFRLMFGGTGDWRAQVVQRMQFPTGMAGAIRELWEKGAAKFAAAQGYQPEPQEFVRSFVDKNFPH
ncbi:hypothetical protein [Sphingomonas sp.]|uniref:hypothetical protein n=1 Tax=Sphingomonas sp. TaxID=28214 RepID=UPI002ED881EA